jgi:hypothetical protein
LRVADDVVVSLLRPRHSSCVLDDCWRGSNIHNQRARRIRPCADDNVNVDDDMRHAAHPRSYANELRNSDSVRHYLCLRFLRDRCRGLRHRRHPRLHSRRRVSLPRARYPFQLLHRDIDRHSPASVNPVCWVVCIFFNHSTGHLLQPQDDWRFLVVCTL